MDSRVASVRAFNRFYTRQIGVLGEHHLDSPFSLTEMRVLYELAHREAPAAADLGRDLGLDAGYLSRILRQFESRGLLARRRSSDDGRQSLLRLTKKGHAVFAPLEARQRDNMASLLGRIPASQQREVVAAMATIQRRLAPTPAEAEPYVLRTHQPGDMGWVIHRHGALYAKEWGYDARFEALVARICADFLDQFEPAGERCWIAEHRGDVVGSVFVVRKSKTVAKLRLLLVEAEARGLGIGKRLIDECIRFARHAGYKKLTLWTQSDLDAARRLYKHAGFTCVHKQPSPNFGRNDLVAETWDLTL